MVDYERKQQRVWTVAEAKARLSEVLRRAEEDGPQRIGTRKEFVVVPARVWEERSEADKTLGQWLLDHMPQFGEVEPARRSEERERPTPFTDWTDAEWEALHRQRKPRDGHE